MYFFDFSPLFLWIPVTCQYDIRGTITFHNSNRDAHLYCNKYEKTDYIGVSIFLLWVV